MVHDLKKKAVLSLKIESSFEKIRRTQIKSAVNRIGKIYIEKKITSREEAEID